MITYDQFLANAQPEDIRVLNLFAMGQRIQHTDTAEADGLVQRIARLDTAGFLLRTTRGYERKEGVLWQTFEGFVDPQAASYLARAASERVQLSRLPLPEVQL